MLTLAVPIYNKEQYLPRCIDSVLAQTVMDYEILLIDDGSADGSGALCDRYAAANPDRIRVIHKPNGGLSSARNAGIEAARGAWITFPDPDDWVEPEYAQTFLTLLQEHGTDMVCTGFWVDESGRRYPGYADGPVQIMSGEAGRRSLLLPPGMGGFSWNKCYRVELLHRHGLRFRSDVGAAEDLDFAYRYLRHCADICFCPAKRTYHYEQHPESVTHSFSARSLEDFRTYEMIAGDEDRALAMAARDTACVIAVNHLWQLMCTDRTAAAMKRILRRHILRNLMIHLQSPCYGPGRKIQAVAAALSPRMFALLKSVARKLRCS